MANSKDMKSGATAEHIEHLDNGIEDNNHATIRNPLAHLTAHELRLQTTSFCTSYGFQEKEELFQKAAILAQRGHDFEAIEELNEDDRYHIRRETTHRWYLPWPLYMCIGIVSLGSAIQGWDNTGANGANLSFPQEFGIEHKPWLIGVINSAPTIFGLASAWAADPVNNLMGRRGAIFFTNLFVVFPVLGQAFTQNWQELLICRLFMGIGMGIKISTIPVYTAEVSPAPIRGGLVTSFQLWVAFGILVGFSSNLIFKDIGVNAWRFQLAAAFAPAVPMMFLIWLCPESPRWYMKKNRYQQAYRSFCRLRNSEIQAARELYSAHIQILLEKTAFEGKTLATRIWELFSIPRLRRATFASAWIVVSQQFSGINIMAFYSSTIFAEGGFSVTQSLLASWGFGLVTFVFAFPAIYSVDTFGRRNLLLLTFPSMALCLLAAGLCFLIDASSAARLPLIALFVYMFSAFYGTGIGPIPSIYFSEAFPLSHREIGASFTICANNALGSALGLTFPSLLERITPTGAFGFYAALNISAVVVIFLFIPETKQLSLEQLDYVFGVSSRRHASYQVRTWLPWWVKRWIFWQRGAPLEPLYRHEVL